MRAGASVQLITAGGVAAGPGVIGAVVVAAASGSGLAQGRGQVFD